MIIFHFLLSIFFFLLYIPLISQQNLKKLFYDAQWYLITNQYSKSLAHYKKLYELDTTNYNYAYLLGLIYFELFGKENTDNALYYFNKAKDGITFTYKDGVWSEKRAPIDVWFYIGLCHLKNLDFENAKIAFKNFLSLSKPYNPYYNYAIRELKKIFYAEQLIKYPYPYEKALFDTIFKDLKLEGKISYPVISEDGNTLIFTGPLLKDFIITNRYKPGNIYWARKINGKWTEPKNITHLLLDEEEKIFEETYNLYDDTLMKVESWQGGIISLALNSNGTELYLVKEDFEEGNIYVSYLKDDTWTPIKKLPQNINYKKWESHVTITTINNTKKIYFTSERPGGYGGLDIYTSVLIDDNKWSDPINLGPNINTPFDEEIASIIGDTILIFSSQGHLNMGGFDLFLSKKQPDGSWGPPINLLYPINTTLNDFYVCLPIDNALYLFRVEPENIDELGVMYKLIELPTKELISEILVENISIATVNPDTINYNFLLALKENKTNLSSDTTIIDINQQLLDTSLQAEIQTKIQEEKSLKLFQQIDTTTINQVEKPSLIEEEAYLVKIKTFVNTPPSFTSTENLKIIIKDSKNNKVLITQPIKANEANEITIDLMTLGYSKTDILEKNYNLQFMFEDIGLETQWQELNLDESLSTQINYTISEKEIVSSPQYEYITIKNIFFDFDQYKLNDSAKEELKKLVFVLKKHKNLKVEICGYTDSKGSKEYNLILSTKRANEVKNFLLSESVSKDQISVKSYGASNFIAINNYPDGKDCPEGRKYNRRVEIKFLVEPPKYISISPIYVPPHLRYLQTDTYIDKSTKYLVIIEQIEAKLLDKELNNKIKNAYFTLKNDNFFKYIKYPIRKFVIKDKIYFVSPAYSTKTKAMIALDKFIKLGFENSYIITEQEFNNLKVSN